MKRVSKAIDVESNFLEKALLMWVSFVNISA